jgi:hypothetical protein
LKGQLPMFDILYIICVVIYIYTCIYIYNVYIYDDTNDIYILLMNYVYHLYRHIYIYIMYTYMTVQMVYIYDDTNVYLHI